MNRLNISLSDHRLKEIFAKVIKDPKMDELDIKGTQNQLNYILLEFENAMDYVQNKRTDDALFHLQLSTQQLIIFFILSTIILLLLFSFIFLGISAFSMVLNSTNIV
jgi:hypothetical protein